MVRYIPTQVPAAMSRLIASTLVKTPPTWYAPVINNPPLAIPLKRATRRNRPHEGAGYDDLPSTPQFDARREGHGLRARARHTREPKQRPRDIVYKADHVRRQFFADFPFEALRPHSLVEADTVRLSTAVAGRAWTALSQRGAYPTVEDTIEFTLNLHEQGLSLSDAYKQATDEFVALRAQHEMMTLAAQGEAVAYGANFKRSEWQRTFDKQARLLNETAASLSGTTTYGDNLPSLKHKEPRVWTSGVNPATVPQGEFTGGVAYAQRWRLPPPLRAGEVAAPAAAASSLLSAIGEAAPVEGAVGEAAGEGAQAEAVNEEEMDDLELMAAILGKN